MACGLFLFDDGDCQASTDDIDSAIEDNLVILIYFYDGLMAVGLCGKC